MNRREALSIVSTLMGGVIIGSGAFLSGCRPTGKDALSTADELPDIDLMDSIGEAILPETAGVPGGKDVHIGEFIQSIVRDCYSPEEHVAFMKGIGHIRKLCQSRFGDDFINLTDDQKDAILNILEDESKKVKMDNNLPHYYRMIKQLVTWGYLSSKDVSLHVLGYVPVPGRYDGCTLYKEGDNAIL